MKIVLRRDRQTSPRYPLTREALRDLARKHSIPRGRNTRDTFDNLVRAGVFEKMLGVAIPDAKPAQS